MKIFKIGYVAKLDHYIKCTGEESNALAFTVALYKSTKIGFRLQKKAL